MGRQLFGTDGVRGRAGEILTAELALAIGRAAVLRSELAPRADGRRAQVLIVRDTRESGPMLESALAAGIAAAGGDALLGGVLPTPAAAVLVKRLGLDLAAVVSASHNPYRDNGIKFFSALGTKLDDEAEARIEALVDADDDSVEPGRVRELNGGGKMATVDVLGEEITREEETRAIAQAYRDVFAAIDEAALDSNVSGQFLHLGLSLSYAMPSPPDGLHAAPDTPFTLNQSRRVRFYERNYYDHPAFGVIALVTPSQGARAPGR